MCEVYLNKGRKQFVKKSRMQFRLHREKTWMLFLCWVHPAIMLAHRLNSIANARKVWSQFPRHKLYLGFDLVLHVHPGLICFFFSYVFGIYTYMCVCVLECGS